MGRQRRGAEAGLGLTAKRLVLADQLWLALAWRLGCAVGNRVARALAAAMHCPAEPRAMG